MKVEVILPRCLTCGAVVTKKPSDLAPYGRPWKHIFCGRPCYNRWRADEHLRVKAEWLHFQREVWGSTPAGRRDPAHTRTYGRPYEIVARDELLPALGFTEIDDWSGDSNQFYVDFVASRDGIRVLADATVKLKAHIPHKIRLARSLRMPLYILHISPLHPRELYWLNEVPLENKSVSRVPAALIREAAYKIEEEKA